MEKGTMAMFHFLEVESASAMFWRKGKCLWDVFYFNEVESMSVMNKEIFVFHFDEVVFFVQ